MNVPRLVVFTFGLTCASLLPRSGAAEAGDAGTAELLFRQGRALLDAGDLAKACPKFEASFKLDPATGTLLGLAMCHEQAGLLASAWAEYAEVEDRAQKEGDGARGTFARNKTAELQTRLSTLTIEVAPAVAGLDGVEVRRNGVLISSVVYGVAVPVDGGSYVVEVTAPGKRPSRYELTLAAERANERLIVQGLLDEPAPAGPTVPERATAPERPAPSGQEHWQMTPMRWAGVGAAGAGVISAAVGGYFLSTALRKQENSDSFCRGTECTEYGATLRNEAASNGNMATVFGVVAAALVGTGGLLFFVVDEPEADTNAARLELTPTPYGCDVRFGGNF